MGANAGDAWRGSFRKILDTYVRYGSPDFAEQGRASFSKRTLDVIKHSRVYSTLLQHAEGRYVVTRRIGDASDARYKCAACQFRTEDFEALKEHLDYPPMDNTEERFLKQSLSKFLLSQGFPDGRIVDVGAWRAMPKGTLAPEGVHMSVGGDVVTPPMSVEQKIRGI